ncbi:MAG TPA: hypothetical protein VFG12_05255 [Rhodopila sp.]|nr:hypothetical protein [Rhodopila sp.]
MSATTVEAPVHPGNLLLNLLVTLLAPIFLGVAEGNIDLARLAALETINDYRARNRIDLIAVAQVIAYGLATLASLSRSMEDDLSDSMTLRFRRNATACTRAAELNRRAIQSNQDPLPSPAPESPDPWPTRSTPEPFLTPDAERLLAEEAEARLHQPNPPHPHPAPNRDPRTQAIAMVQQALHLDASIPHLPQSERAAAADRVAQLNCMANQLLAGLDPPLGLAAGG